MGKLCRRWLLVSGWVLCMVASASAAGRSEALSTPELLLDLARTHGLDCQGNQSASDAQHIRTLLRAATRLDPRLVDAHIWLHELAMLRGDQVEAATALQRLIAADPTHQVAFAKWLEVGQQGGQTIEERIEWLEYALARGPQQPELRALVHEQLSRLSLAKFDLDVARQHLKQALALAPWHPGAVELQYELLEPTAPASVRLEAALKLLQLSPFSLEVAWEIGLLLDQYGYHADADQFYDHALEVHARVNPLAPVAGAYLLQLARHAVAREQIEQAEQYARQAVLGDPLSASEAGIFLYWLLTHLPEQEQEASHIREQLAERFAELREPSEWPVNESVQAAWFYCTIDDQPRRGLMLAESAAHRVPDDLFAQRVLGWAQAVNLQAEQAKATLAPLVTHDPYAAYQLARLFQKEGDDETARRIVRELTPLPTAGPARELINQLGFSEITSRSTAHRHLEIAEVLGGFDREVLSFHREPERFLRAAITFDNRTPDPGEPWWAHFTLTNQADFPITLGPEWMVNPIFLLSFELEGNKKREYPYLFTVTVDRVRVLAPGESVRISRTLALGSLHRLARKTPQQAQRISVTAILDPVRGPHGRWEAGLAGQRLRPVYFNRLPARTSREALSALLRALASVSDSIRFRAVEQMAELLSEKQRADLGRLNYKPQPIPAARIQQALLAALSGESWELRARALDALQIAGFNANMLQAAQECLEHPHWLVRLMAVRLLGERQGQPAAGLLQELSRNDADELVRELADSYLMAWNSAPAATQPAAVTSSQPTKLETGNNR